MPRPLRSGPTQGTASKNSSAVTYPKSFAAKNGEKSQQAPEGDVPQGDDAGHDLAGGATSKRPILVLGVLAFDRLDDLLDELGEQLRICEERAEEEAHVRRAAHPQRQEHRRQAEVDGQREDASGERLRTEGLSP